MAKFTRPSSNQKVLYGISADALIDSTSSEDKEFILDNGMLSIMGDNNGDAGQVDIENIEDENDPDLIKIINGVSKLSWEETKKWLEKNKYKALVVAESAKPVNLALVPTFESFIGESKKKKIVEKSNEIKSRYGVEATFKHDWVLDTGYKVKKGDKVTIDINRHDPNTSWALISVKINGKHVGYAESQHPHTMFDIKESVSEGKVVQGGLSKELFNHKIVQGYDYGKGWWDSPTTPEMDKYIESKLKAEFGNDLESMAAFLVSSYARAMNDDMSRSPKPENDILKRTQEQIWDQELKSSFKNAFKRFKDDIKKEGIEIFYESRKMNEGKFSSMKTNDEKHTIEFPNKPKVKEAIEALIKKGLGAHNYSTTGKHEDTLKFINPASYKQAKGILNESINEGKNGNTVTVSVRDAKKAHDIFNDSYSKLGEMTSTNSYSFKDQDDMDSFIGDLKKQKLEILNEMRTMGGYDLETDEIGRFWVVTRPSRDSEVIDICFESDILYLANQIRGGLKEIDIIGFYRNEKKATDRAKKLIDGLKP